MLTKNSNKKIIKNSISVCLAGETNKQVREDVLKILDTTDHPYYIILFRGNLGRQDFKALYSHDGSGYVEKIYGPTVPTIPEILDELMVEKFFRYDSGNKVFKELTGIKTFSLTTDAVSLNQTYVKKISNNMIY